MSDIQQYGNYLTFGDIRSNDYYVWISGEGTYDAPERDVENITIPGRSGDLIRDNKRFKNIPITYPAFISKGFDRRFDVFKAAMLAKAGYRLLWDTYHPSEFRMASYVGAVEPKTGPYNKAGRFDLVFDCQPQRWLKVGLEFITLQSSGVMSNPTLYPSKPLIRVYGAGTVGVGGDTVTVEENVFPYIDIDCEAMDARYGASNANSYVSVSGDDFPELPAGDTGVTLSTGITRVDIQPRWWTV